MIAVFGGTGIVASVDIRPDSEDCGRGDVEGKKTRERICMQYILHRYREFLDEGEGGPTVLMQL